MQEKKGESMNRMLLKVVVMALVMGLVVTGSVWAQEMATVDINSATAEELAKLPGLDETIANNIISFREANGPFPSVDDLLKVEGMSQSKLDAIRDLIRAGEWSGPAQTPGPATE